MTNELEKQFFDTFGIGKPKLKVWRYSGYYEDYSWDSELIDCAELLEGNNWTIEELDERIQTSKQEEKEKNSELYDYRFDSVETEFGKTTKAFVEYPQISDRILLELFDILRKYYNLDFWTIDDSFVMDVRDKQASYTNIIYRTGGDFKNSILRSLNLIVKDKLISNDKIKHQVRTLFEEG